MNGILLIDKPEGWTSHDVVAKLRGILREKRIGHSGTLDPMATGLLVVFVGRATRAVEFAETHEKEYIASLRPGLVTDTQDITGNITGRSEKKFNFEELTAVLPEFTGDITQIPPMYSAVKINGRKLYALARSGVEIERKGRPVNIRELEITGEKEGDFILRVVCSKGTYIRTLCSDIGERLGTGAVLSALRRTRVGNYSVLDANTLDGIMELAANGALKSALLPVDSLFSDYPSLTLTDAQKAKCLCGGCFEKHEEDGKYRVYAGDGTFLMLGKVENGVMSTVKSFFEVN